MPSTQQNQNITQLQQASLKGATGVIGVNHGIQSMLEEAKLPQKPQLKPTISANVTVSGTIKPDGSGITLTTENGEEIALKRNRVTSVPLGDGKQAELVLTHRKVQHGQVSSEQISINDGQGKEVASSRSSTIDKDIDLGASADVKLKPNQVQVMRNGDGLKYRVKLASGKTFDLSVDNKNVDGETVDIEGKKTRVSLRKRSANHGQMKLENVTIRIGTKSVELLRSMNGNISSASPAKVIDTK